MTFRSKKPFRIKIKAPISEWARTYDRRILHQDLMAAGIVTVLLIPQSLAYAMLAGLPPEVGLYSCILPLIAYGIFGSSRTMSVGPVAILSLMTAVAVRNLQLPNAEEMVMAAVTITLLVSMLLLLMGMFKLGFIANFLSHPVVTGFITASGIVILVSQIRYFFGVETGSKSTLETVIALISKLHDAHLITIALSIFTLALLVVPRLLGGRYLTRKSQGSGKWSLVGVGIMVKTLPVIAVILTTFIVWLMGLDQKGVAIVGSVPSGLPSMIHLSETLGYWSVDQWQDMLLSALLISIIGFVESISIAQTLAAKKRQRIEPDQELMGLGYANVCAGFSGGMPVAGGLSRSVVNFEAGAVTPMAGIFAAFGVSMVILFFTPLIYFLPKATLAATIVVSTLTLIDIRGFKRTWRYSRVDFASMFTTLFFTLFQGVEIGLLLGVSLSVLLHLYRTSKPHSAILGRVSGTEHFRNVERYDVETDPRLIALRVDESLYFANARYLEDRIYDLVADNTLVEHVILVCPAVNVIDASAIESLEAVNSRLIDRGVAFHLSEVKGPVMDQLQRSHLLKHLSGQVFMSQYQAWLALKKI